MVHSTSTMMEHALKDISRQFARIAPWSDTDSCEMDVLHLIIDCIELYALQHLQPAISEHVRRARSEDRRPPSANEIPKALPALASLTSALAGGFFDCYCGYNGDDEKNKEHFVDKMMKECNSNIEDWHHVRDEETDENDSADRAKKRRDEKSRAVLELFYGKVSDAMHTLAAEQDGQGASEHLNPKPLWRLGSKGAEGIYSDGPMPQLITRIERYREGGHNRLRNFLSKRAAMEQMRDIALASMALLNELGLVIKARNKVESNREPDPMLVATEAPQPAVSPCSVEYCNNLDAAEIIRRPKVARRVAKSWKASSSEWYRIRGERAREDIGDATSNAPSAASMDINRVNGAKAQLMHDMREALIEGMLKRVKQEVKSRYPKLSKTQLDYIVILPTSLSLSDMESKESIAHTIRHEVESVVTMEVIDGLMDEITQIATSDIDAFLDEWRSSKILGRMASLLARIQQIFACLMDSITGTNSHKAELRNNLAADAEAKLIGESIERIAKNQTADSNMTTDAEAEPIGESMARTSKNQATDSNIMPESWSKCPLSNLREATHVAFTGVVEKSKIMREKAVV